MIFSSEYFVIKQVTSGEKFTLRYTADDQSHEPSLTAIMMILPVFGEDCPGQPVGFIENR